MARTRGSRDSDYDAKRAALIGCMMDRLARAGDTRPSLRQLADAAGVTIPTLRHYFGDRDGIVDAVFTEWHSRGAVFLDMAACPSGPLAKSLADYLTMFVMANRDFEFAKIIAVGLVEGLLDEGHGPVFLQKALDPMIDALERRLQAHVEAGEMIPGVDLHFAAVSLIGPVLVLCLHQYQLFGQSHLPTDMEAFVEHQVRMFVSAFEN